MVRYLFKLIRVIHSDRDAGQIALGFSLGMVPGLTPLQSPHNLLILLAILFFRVNIGAAVLSFSLFSMIAFAVDPALHQIGLYVLLQVPALTGLWTSLYNAPLFPYTRFNNTIVMGSLIVSACLFLPCFWGGKYLIHKYRETVMEHINRWKILEIIKASRVYQLYLRYNV